PPNTLTSLDYSDQLEKILESFFSSNRQGHLNADLMYLVEPSTESTYDNPRFGLNFEYSASYVGKRKNTPSPSAPCDAKRKKP
ncbi:MAG TPA: hypothetical protein VI959_04675, partial [Alphaproteobacteria bacterium]|nr:hypothetical protein [Alphaproteobacteria bacterium]